MESADAENLKLHPKPLGLLGRDEMNLAEFPITLLADRVPKDQKEAIYQDEIYDDRTGRTLARKLTIQAGNYGLTTAVDDELILALIQITKQKNNFTNRHVEFSRHELIQTLGWQRTGPSYERILNSLQKWTSVYLQYENAWRDNRTKTWKTLGFHIIDMFEFNDSRTSSDQADLIPSYIVWNEVIFESFQAGYLKPLDYDLCMGFGNSTAKRMYRFLDKRFYHKSDWLFDLKEFAHEHIGLGRNYEGPAHLKRKLQPAIDELERVGFLAPLPKSNRFIKDGKNWKIRLIQQSFTSIAVPNAIAATPEPSPLVTALTERGITAKTAAELVAKYPAESIRHKIEVFDWLASKQDKRIAKSPEGYLVKSITDDYEPPKGLIPTAQRQKIEEAEKAKADAEAEERRRKQQAEAQEQAERAALDSYLKPLAAAERASLEAKALAAADEKTQAAYNNSAMQAFRTPLMSLMLRDYLRPVLNRQTPAKP